MSYRLSSRVEFYPQMRALKRLTKKKMSALSNSYIRRVLEYSYQVWHTSVTQQQCEQIEKVQKCAIPIIYGSLGTQALSGSLNITLSKNEDRIYCSFGE